jgi:flagellar hook assembly protein FlgD
MKVRAVQRIQYLIKWKQSSALNTTNAQTGATLTSHQTHTIVWNCTDNTGNVLPDGDYQFWVEFTEDEAQGPFTSYTFTKGTAPVNTNFANQTNFKSVSIVYTPDNIAVESIETLEAVVINNSNARLTMFRVPTVPADNALLQIYEINGRKVFETQYFIDNGELRTFQWVAKDADKAKIYVYRLENGAVVYKGKFYKSIR